MCEMAIAPRRMQRSLCGDVKREAAGVRCELWRSAARSATGVVVSVRECAVYELWSSAARCATWVWLTRRSATRSACCGDFRVFGVVGAGECAALRDRLSRRGMGVVCGAGFGCVE